MSGKVLMEDGSPPPEQVTVEKVCGGGVPEPVARTDPKGGFVVRWSSELHPVDAKQGSTTPLYARLGGETPNDAAQRSARGSAAPSVIPAGCSVQARLAGYQSSSIVVVNPKALDLGTIILRRTSGGEGTTVSITSLKAPKNAQKAYDKAMKALEKKKFDEARAELEKATSSYPEYAAAWFELGRVRQYSRELGPAREAYEQAIKTDPKFVKPYVQLATVLNAEQKYEQLVSVTATAIKLDPVGFPAAHLLNAMGNLRLGDMQAAAASARQAVKLDPQHAFPEAEYTLGVALGNLGDYQGAAEHLRTYLQVAPDSPSAGAVKLQLAEFEQLAKTAPAAPR
jgi:tetratricopeptide (TPR) repeat protein